MKGFVNVVVLSDHGIVQTTQKNLLHFSPILDILPLDFWYIPPHPPGMTHTHSHYTAHSESEEVGQDRVAQIVASWHPGCAEMERKWGNEVGMVRDWLSRVYISSFSLHFLPLSPFPHSPSISSLSVHFLHQNLSHITYALWFWVEFVVRKLGKLGWPGTRTVFRKCVRWLLLSIERWSTKSSWVTTCRRGRSGGPENIRSSSAFFFMYNICSLGVPRLEEATLTPLLKKWWRTIKQPTRWS